MGRGRSVPRTRRERTHVFRIGSGPRDRARPLAPTGVARRSGARSARGAAVAALAALAATAAPAVAHAGGSSRPGGAAPEVAPALTAASFADPPATVRPKYRWWLPLAYEDDAQLVAELRQMKQAGAGGAEVAAFSVEGAGSNRNPFLETYGWGTPTWSQKLATIFGAARDENLRVDLTIGPRWPATVPTVADVNDPRAQQQLVFAHEFDAGGSSRDGALPTNFNVRPPAGARTTLVAALAARCLDPACGRQAAGPRLLDRASVVDVTADVAADGTLHHDFPGDASSTWTVIAFYQTAAGDSLSGYTPTGDQLRPRPPQRRRCESDDRLLRRAHPHAGRAAADRRDRRRRPVRGLARDRQRAEVDLGVPAGVDETPRLRPDDAAAGARRRRRAGLHGGAVLRLPRRRRRPRANRLPPDLERSLCRRAPAHARRLGRPPRHEHPRAAVRRPDRQLGRERPRRRARRASRSRSTTTSRTTRRSRSAPT